MTVKKRKVQDKLKIEVQTRKPESRGIFANIGKDREKQTDKHPLREIMNFPSSESKIESLDSQNLNLRIADNSIESYPNPKEMDIQSEVTGNPELKILDSQNENFGYPVPENLDILIAKDTGRIAKNEENSAINISKNKNLDSQTPAKNTTWKKYDEKRKAKGIFLRTNDDLTKKFKQFCISNDWDFSHGTELAWNKLMVDLDSQREGGLDSLIALDDRRMKMIFKTKPSIINLYLRYNTIFTPGTKWKTKDDETASQFNDLDLTIIELGIIQAQINKYQSDPTGSINSFKYYRQEIENFARLGLDSGTLEKIVEINRKNWAAITGKSIDLSFLEIE